jgi:dihydrofolate reductase
MRKVIVSEFVSLDGIMEAPGPDGSDYQHAGWTMGYASEAFMKFKFDELMASGAMLLGRRTYEGFAAAWPGRSGDAFSDKMNEMPKYIVSKTLKTADWDNSHIILPDLKKEVALLRAAGDDDLLVAGSAQLVRGLLAAGLVDELHLLVYPIILGTGKQLFLKSHKVALQLTHHETFDSGVVALKYRPEK